MKESGFDQIRKDGYTVTLRWTDALWAAVTALLGVVCLELFYRMIVDYEGRYMSDVRYYVNLVQDGQNHDYRLLGFVFQRLYDLNQGSMEINIFLALVIVAIVVVNFLVLRYFLKDDGVQIPRTYLQFFSVTVLFMGPIYVPVIHEWFYRRSFESFAWHSPTQQAMTLFSLIAMLCFLKMCRESEQRIHLGWWLATMAAAFLSAFAKPGFMIGMIITMVILFVIELLEGGKEGLLPRLGRLFILGCSLIPSGIYILILRTIEFNAGSGGDTEDHHIIFGLTPVLEYPHLWAAILFGLAFPIVVFAMNLKRLKDRKYRFAVGVFLMGTLQWALITETGKRGNYGNFGWGRVCGSYILTLVSVVLALENYRDPSFLQGREKARTMYFILLAVLLVLSLLSQLYYFYLILSGQGYMH